MKSTNLNLIAALILIYLIIFSIMLTSCQSEEKSVPRSVMNTTYDYLTNGGTSKTWNLDSTAAEGKVFTLDQGWYEADYTYYGNKLLTITHPSYTPLVMNYHLYLDSLIVFGYYGQVPVVLRFKINSINHEKMVLTRLRYNVFPVSEYYTRK